MDRTSDRFRPEGVIQGQRSDYSRFLDFSGDANQPFNGNVISRSDADKRLSETRLLTTTFGREQISSETNCLMKRDHAGVSHPCPNVSTHFLCLCPHNSWLEDVLL